MVQTDEDTCLASTISCKSTICLHELLCCRAALDAQLQSQAEHRLKTATAAVQFDRQQLGKVQEDLVQAVQHKLQHNKQLQATLKQQLDQQVSQEGKTKGSKARVGPSKDCS